jgi:tetratricopeptide (TPR) repeat protein
VNRESVEERYQRADVLRIVGISARQLAGWERAGLIPISESYTFTDLVQLTRLRKLRGHVPSRVIQRTLKACSVSGLRNPLVESTVLITSSHRIAVKHDGAQLDPTTGQFLFDFGVPQGQDNVVPIRSDRDRARDLFLLGIQLEESPDTVPQAIEVYSQLLAIEPRHAAAQINLGTLRYNQQDFKAAEACYRKAIEADPAYALAYFDLGNVLDEMGRLDEAIAAYERALGLNRDYADAHYNIALAYERTKLERKALPHWEAYCRLDPSGPWSNHAQAQADRIRQKDQLKIVWRNH